MSKPSFMNSVIKSNNGKVNSDDSTNGDIDNTSEDINNSNNNNNNNNNIDVDENESWIDNGQANDRVQVVEGK